MMINIRKSRKNSRRVLPWRPRRPYHIWRSGLSLFKLRRLWKRKRPWFKAGKLDNVRDHKFIKDKIKSNSEPDSKFIKLVLGRMDWIRKQKPKKPPCDHDFGINGDQCLKCGVSIWRYAAMELP